MRVPALAAAGLLAAVAALPPALAEAPDAVTEEFNKFRAVMEEDNPAELFAAKGEELWKAKRGPKNASLEQCDLGLGPGVVKGAYVQMPRYFADAGKVMDAERRVVWCMVTLQGFTPEELAKKPFASDDATPDQTSILTWVAAQSAGMPFAVPDDAHTRHAFALGREIAAYRAGPYDFSCSTCHGQDGKRIRMQLLPNIATREGAAKAVLGWPGYRMTGGVMLTMQWRMNDCFRQQRFPEPKYLSDTVTDLLTYMTVNANGTVYGGPGIKR